MGIKTLNLLSGLTFVSPERWGNQKIFRNNLVCNAFHFGTVEGNDARLVTWEGYQRERTSIPLWSHYNDGANL